MERVLPIIVIYDTSYYVDLQSMEFRQVDDPLNSIPFSEVKDQGNHSLVLFDKATKTAIRAGQQPPDPSPNIVPVVLPPLEDLDPPGLREMQQQAASSRSAHAVILFRKIAAVHKSKVVNSRSIHRTSTSSHGNRLRNKQRH